VAGSLSSYRAEKDAAWRKLLDSPVAGISYEYVSGTVSRNGSWAVKLTSSIPVAAFKSCDEGAWNFVDH
jgi:hypothetical protein